MPSILCSNARAPVAQLVRASDRNLEDPGSNPGWISMSFFLPSFNSANKKTLSISEHKAGISTLYDFSSEGEMFLVGSYKWGYYPVRWWQHKVLWY